MWGAISTEIPACSGRGEQRGGAMALVIVAAPLGLAGRERQDHHMAIEKELVNQLLAGRDANAGRSCRCQLP